MSKAHPFQPSGRCVDCKFSAPIPKNHWKSQYYPLFCYRLPKAPAHSSMDIWSQEVCVKEQDFCAMFENDNHTKLQEQMQHECDEDAR